MVASDKSNPRTTAWARNPKELRHFGSDAALVLTGIRT
jgi:hypothetical protein